MSLQIRSFRCNRVGALAAVASSARPRASAQQLPARSYRRRLYPEHRADGSWAMRAAVVLVR